MAIDGPQVQGTKTLGLIEAIKELFKWFMAYLSKQVDLFIKW
jgi:hypothetical protein